MTASEEYLKEVLYGFGTTERPWEGTKRITQCRERCLVTYAGMWPANQWPDPTELGWFLAGFLGHILAGHDGSCHLCDEWHKPKGERTAIWPSICIPPAPGPCPVLTKVRLVERIPWDVKIESEYRDFESPGQSLNDAFRKSFPRLTVYGRYGVELTTIEEKHDG